MSNAEFLAELRDEILAIPDDQVIAIRIPVDIAVQEAENLFQWSKMDLPELSKLGITEEKLNKLNAHSGACREAQSLWVRDKRMVKEARQEWNENMPVAYDLCNELQHTYRYAFRKDESLLGRLSQIAEGAGHADMIQDLNDLAVLGKENSALLEAIQFDLAKLDLAAEKSSEMADLLAIANGSKQVIDESKQLRDKAYTHLKLLVDEIREAGKYLFWKKPARLEGYRSDYYRRKNSGKKKEKLSLTED